jgi:dihydropteroate synthase
MRSMLSSFHSKDKNTDFSRTVKFEFQGKQLEKKGPLLMGILNITPDSFFAGSRIELASQLIITAEKMLHEGADILDLGAFSTRPGAAEVSEEEELKRIIPAVKAISEAFKDVVISVDTFRTKVAEKAVEAGAMMINDISGGTFDTNMPSFIGSNDVPYVMMHLFGTPENRHQQYQGKELIQHVEAFFEEQIRKFERFGARQIVLDPGFGFGKTMEGNYQLVARFNELRYGDYPLLAGVSRKSMIHKTLNINPEEALNGSTVLHTFLILNGADILRVHDVKPAREAIDLCMKISEGRND